MWLELKFEVIHIWMAFKAMRLDEITSKLHVGRKWQSLKFSRIKNLGGMRCHLAW